MILLAASTREMAFLLTVVYYCNIIIIVVEALHGSHVFCLSSHVRWRSVRAQRENTKRILLLFSYGNIICRHLQICFFSGLYILMGYTFYHILEVSYCVIQILMQTVRPRAVLWSV